jgi:RNA polymerase sigma-70 factor, ECF subfamily
VESKSHKDYSTKDHKLNEIMIEYGTEVFRLVYSYVKRKDIAEDITQTVFTKCYINLDNYEGNSSIKTWLFKIAINTCKDYFKSWHYKYSFLHEKLNYFTHNDTPEKLVIKKNENYEITKKIMSLPKKYRELIYLYYFEGISLKEISDLLETNINTIKSRHRRAKEILRDLLDEEV